MFYIANYSIYASLILITLNIKKRKRKNSGLAIVILYFWSHTHNSIGHSVGVFALGPLVSPLVRHAVERFAKTLFKPHHCPLVRILHFLQDFAALLPPMKTEKSRALEQGKGAADHLMPLGNWFLPLVGFWMLMLMLMPLLMS